MFTTIRRPLQDTHHGSTPGMSLHRAVLGAVFEHAKHPHRQLKRARTYAKALRTHYTGDAYRDLWLRYANSASSRATELGHLAYTRHAFNACRIAKWKMGEFLYRHVHMAGPRSVDARIERLRRDIRAAARELRKAEHADVLGRVPVWPGHEHRAHPKASLIHISSSAWSGYAENFSGTWYAPTWDRPNAPVLEAMSLGSDSHTLWAAVHSFFIATVCLAWGFPHVFYGYPAWVLKDDSSSRSDHGRTRLPRVNEVYTRGALVAAPQPVNALCNDKMFDTWSTHSYANKTWHSFAARRHEALPLMLPVDHHLAVREMLDRIPRLKAWLKAWSNAEANTVLSWMSNTPWSWGATGAYCTRCARVTPWTALLANVDAEELNSTPNQLEHYTYIYPQHCTECDLPPKGALSVSEYDDARGRLTYVTPRHGGVTIIE